MLDEGPMRDLAVIEEVVQVCKDVAVCCALLPLIGGLRNVC